MPRITAVVADEQAVAAGRRGRPVRRSRFRRLGAFCDAQQVEFALWQCRPVEDGGERRLDVVGLAELCETCGTTVLDVLRQAGLADE
jgi:hypothetical protein